MESWSRRKFLGTLGLMAAATASCSQGAEPAAKGTLKWWDHYNSLQDLHKKILDDFSASPGGVPTEYTFYQSAQFAESIQLAKQSGQQPDVHSLGEVTVPLPALIEGGWFQPLELSDQVLAGFGKNDLVDGVHRFDGKLYSFPIFSYRWHHAMLWYHVAMLDKIGMAPPKTFDEFREACRRAKNVGDNVSGWVGGLKENNSYFHVPNVLAQAAGFPGQEGLDYRTGEIRYNDDAYLEVFELFESLRKDRLLFQGANSVNNLEARGRWAAGEGVFIFDGPFQVGSVKRDFPEALDGMGLAGLITSNPGMPRHVYKPYRLGEFYVAKSSKMADEANKLLGMLTTPEYYKKLAAFMDQPPRDLDIVADSPDAHPLYKQVVADYAEHVLTGPAVTVGNPDIALVAAETKPVTPNLDHIFASFVSGDVPDYRKALTKLSSQLMTERDRAIKAANAKGAKASVDDYVFGNWTPGKEYTVDMYGQR